MVFSVILNGEFIYITNLISSFLLSLSLLFLLLSLQLCGWRLLLVVPLFWWCPKILLQSPLSFLCTLICQCRQCCFLSLSFPVCFFFIAEQYVVYQLWELLCLAHFFYLLLFFFLSVLVLFSLLCCRWWSLSCSSKHFFICIVLIKTFCTFAS